MPTVTLSMHVYEKDKDKLYSNFGRIQGSHKYPFDQYQIIHQRCKPGKWFKGTNTQAVVIYEEDYQHLISKFGMDIDDPRGKEISGDSHWWWPNHTVNHLAGLDRATSDYIVFSDSDCIMVRNEGWIERGIEILESDPHIFVVSPGDGNPCKTQIMSQQLFLIERESMLNMDWNCWNGKMDMGAFKFYYHMTEGRIGSFMLKQNLYRQVLGNEFRYWHSPDEHKVPPEYEEAVKDWK